MNAVEAALRQISNDLESRVASWALVGGFAVSARAEPRFTRDVDVAVAVADDQTAEHLVISLRNDGYRVVASMEQDAVGRLAIVSLIRPADDDAQTVVIDVLFASSGIEPEIAAAAEPIEILPGLVVPVARTGHLIAVKLLARDDQSRPQDLSDLRALVAVASDEELELARKAAGLIAERGFDRGRDLVAALGEFIGG